MTPALSKELSEAGARGAASAVEALRGTPGALEEEVLEAREDLRLAASEASRVYFRARLDALLLVRP